MAETIAEYYYRQGESSGFMSGKAEDQRSLLEALNEAISERFSKTIDQEIAERFLKAPSSDPKAFIKWSVILGQSKTWDDFLKRTGWNDLK